MLSTTCVYVFYYERVVRSSEGNQSRSWQLDTTTEESINKTKTEQPVADDYTYVDEIVNIIGPVVYASVVAADTATSDETIAVELIFQDPAYEKVEFCMYVLAE